MILIKHRIVENIITKTKRRLVMNLKSIFRSLILLIIFSAFISSCMFQGVKINKGDEWLASKNGKAEVDISGSWNSPEWGFAMFNQVSNTVTGTLNDYNIKGVVSGREIYLYMYTANLLKDTNNPKSDKDVIHYSAKLVVTDEKTLNGYYVKYDIFEEVPEKVEPISSTNNNNSSKVSLKKAITLYRMK
jgi:hypothetical protein